MKGNEPAFPSTHVHPLFDKDRLVSREGFYGREGMTLRDYFAAKAMEGRLSLGGWELDVLFGPNAENPKGHKNEAERVAYLAYLMADAMLAEKERTEK